MASTKSNRQTYHHGDLRNALIAAGATLAEEGGPDAVGIRPAARLVGVTPTAAYRHFADAEELLEAVKDRTFQLLIGEMRENIARVDTTGSPATRALSRLEGIGHAYIDVALAEPGLFRVAFSERGSVPRDGTEPLPSAIQILVSALDDLVAAGVLAPDRRPMAEFAAWSAVHGFVRLVLDGLLSQLPEEMVRAAADRVIEMVTYSFSQPDSPRVVS